MNKKVLFLVLFILFLGLITWLILPLFIKYDFNKTILGGRNYKIGVIHMGGVYSEVVSGLKLGMNLAGFVENHNIKYFEKDLNGDITKAEKSVNAMFKEGVNLIYTVSTPVTSEVWKNVGKDFPIVFNVVGDPIGVGFTKSYLSSETNLTGLTNLSAELSGKRLEIFKEAFPAIRDIVTFYDPENEFSQISIVETRSAAKKLGINLSEVKLRNLEDLDKAVNNLTAGEYDGIYIVPDSMVVSQVGLIINKANELKIPTMGHVRTLAVKGVTLTYGANFYNLGRQSADTVVKIILGEKPSNIPIQTPDKLEIIINQDNVQANGLSVSPQILSQADSIITQENQD